MFLYIWSIALMRPQCAKMLNYRTREQTMKRIFVHPNVNNVSGADVSKVYNMGKSQLQKAGLNFDTSSLDVGMKLASGDISGGVGDMATQLTGNQTVGVAAQVLTDIVQTVIMKGAASVDNADKAQLANAKKQAEGINNQHTINCNAADEYTKQMLAQLNSTIEGGTGDISGMQSVIMKNSQTMRETLENNKATNEEKQQQIEENNKKIEDNRNKMNDLLSQINTKKQEAKVRVESHNPKKAQGKDGDNKDGITGQKGETLLGDSGNEEIDALIQQYNVHACDTEMLTQLNQALTTQIQEGNEETQNQAQETTEVSDEQAAEIDAKAVDILAEADNAQQAISEIKNLLSGQFPKLDNAMAIRLAGEVAKAGISGTESGLLATAAAAAGASSIFSFGTTASTAIELGTASKNKATDSFANFAQASVEKTMQNYMKSLMQQSLSNIMDGMGLEADMKNMFMGTFNDIKTELAQNKDEDNKTKEEAQTSTA